MMLKDEQLAHHLKQTLTNLSEASEGSVATIAAPKSTAYKINHGPGIIGFLAEATLVVRQFQQTMQHLVQQVESGQGTAGLLVRDTTLAEDVKQSVDDIQSGVMMFNENMEALRHSFLLRRYYKKQQKQKEQQP